MLHKWFQVCVLLMVVGLLEITSARLQHSKRKVPHGQLKWPELVGKTGDQAKAAIKAEYPELNVEIWAHNDPGRLTKDYHLNRVKILLDKNGKVHSVPIIGY